MLKEGEPNALKEGNKEILRQLDETIEGHADRRKTLNLQIKEEEIDQEGKNPMSQRQSTTKTSNYSMDL